jgi:uncharacterized protein YbaP (TraB family)
MRWNGGRGCRAAVFCLALVLLGTSSAGSAAAKNFLWEVKSDKATVYLFGSIHYAKADMYPLDEAIEDAFARSPNLVLEINPLKIDQAGLAQQILAEGMYMGERTIKDDLSPEVFAMLEEYARRAGLPIEAFLNMKPAVLTLTLSSLEFTRQGYDPQQGIDLYFARKAGESKPILELETVKEQLDMLLGLPDASLLLMYTIRDLARVGEQIDEIVKLWKAGDADGMDEAMIGESLREEPRVAPILEKILFERNVTMTEKIKEHLSAGKSCFVVVGAAHFVGDRGIVRLLEKEGYRVRQF